jgi:hypothetical protein
MQQANACWRRPAALETKCTGFAYLPLEAEEADEEAAPLLPPAAEEPAEDALPSCPFLGSAPQAAVAEAAAEPPAAAAPPDTAQPSAWCIVAEPQPAACSNSRMVAADPPARVR